MRRPAFYSRSPDVPQDARAPAATPDAPAPSTAATPISPAPPTLSKPARPRRLMPWLAALCTVLVASGLFLAMHGPLRSPRALTQKDIDAAVLHTLRTATLPSPTAKAAQIIAPSVVRVIAYGSLKKTPAARTERRGRNLARSQAPDATSPPGEEERGVGTGVVIVDSGVVLTNLHVVLGAERLELTFADGLRTGASVVGAQPENDLAILQAHKIPDDLVPATLHSSRDLQPGERVAVVGFPFGIGPSVSAGVVSGLQRAFRSPEGQQEINNLIQFDAAANPGNSGGPLVNMDGEVLGIVTAILNPTQQRTFIGIGFAVPIESAASAAGMPPF